MYIDKYFIFYLFTCKYIGAKSAGGRFSFHPFNHIRITPGASTNSTPKKMDIATAGSENNVIDGIKPAENGISLEASLASIGKTPKLVHSKSTGNLLGGKMRRIKEVLRYFLYNFSKMFLA